jgi:chorismate dehydratase
MEKIRISAVRYANTYPFIFGLTEYGFNKKAVLETDHPADCALKLINGRSDLGLMPVAAIPLLKEARIIGDYCIGANGKVRTVQIMSNTPFEDVKTVYLDYRSRSSARLIKVIAASFWKREFKWVDTTSGFNFEMIGNEEAVVLIGDQCFEFEGKYLFKCDLSEEWKKYTGLPFVFACWVANKPLPDEFTEDFNNALSYGVNNIDLVVERFCKTGAIRGTDLRKYLTENIDFILDTNKRKAMDLFLDLQKSL